MLVRDITRCRQQYSEYHHLIQLCHFEPLLQWVCDILLQSNGERDAEGGNQPRRVSVSVYGELLCLLHPDWLPEKKWQRWHQRLSETIRKEVQGENTTHTAACTLVGSGNAAASDIIMTIFLHANGFKLYSIYCMSLRLCTNVAGFKGKVRPIYVWDRCAHLVRLPHPLTSRSQTLRKINNINVHLSASQLQDEESFAQAHLQSGLACV